MKLYSPSFLDDPFGLFEDIIQIKTTTDIKNDGCLILWGGEDIFSGIYNEIPNQYVRQMYTSARDKREIEMIQHCVKMDIPMIGICRGAQLMCVMAGGKLVQHIENHGMSHGVTLFDEGDTVISCNSSHHQMMLPPPGARILAGAAQTTGRGEYNKHLDIPSVNEVVWFPSIKALGIQPHPEWENSPIQFNEYCKRKIKEFIL